MENKTIGEVISEHRKQKGLTQRALAEQLNVTDKAVSKWERDIARPDIHTVPRLAEILDIPIEMLLNIPINANSEAETTQTSGQESASKVLTEDKTVEACDEEREGYKNKVKHLLRKGIFGFIAGFLFVLIVTLSDGDTFNFAQALGVGILLTGAPYGWELLGLLIGRWYVVGHIAIMILTVCLKLVGAILIGWAVYPFALLYNIVKSQRKGSIARKIWSVVFAVVITLIAALAFVIFWAGYRQNQNTTKDYTADVTPVLNKYAQVDASMFDDTSSALAAVCEKTMELCEENETEQEESGSSVVTPNAIQAIYYLKVKDLDAQHYEYGKNEKFTNAVLVITSCRVNIGNWLERDQWSVWVYPDFYMNSEHVLMYETEKEHSNFIGEQTQSKVYEYVCEEYYDMDVYELNVPTLS